MIVRWQAQFKDDYALLQKRKDFVSLKKALNKALTLFQTGKDISKSFPVNRLIKRGEGWFDCYVTSDIVIIYRIQGQSVKLTAIGPAKKMYDR